jgi:hypothetical protein
MTAPIRQRVPLAASDERVVVRRRAARHDRAVAAAGVLPAKPRHAGCGLISLPRLSAHDHDDVTLVSLREHVASSDAGLLPESRAPGASPLSLPAVFRPDGLQGGPI